MTQAPRTYAASAALMLGIPVTLIASPVIHAADGESVGVVMVTRGEVYARTPEDERRDLERRSELFVGDTVFTGPRARAQLRLEDGQTLTLRHDTELRIEAFDYDADTEEGESRKSLIEGGLRAITGAISGEDDYSIDTPVATIGVRGTTSEVAHSDDQGTFGGTTRGGGWAQNRGSDDVQPQRIDVGDGADTDYYHVVDAVSPPEALVERPAQLESLGDEEVDEEDDLAEDEDAETPAEVPDDEDDDDELLGTDFEPGPITPAVEDDIRTIIRDVETEVTLEFQGFASFPGVLDAPGGGLQVFSDGELLLEFTQNGLLPVGDLEAMSVAIFLEALVDEPSGLETQNIGDATAYWGEWDTDLDQGELRVTDDDGDPFLAGYDFAFVSATNVITEVSELPVSGAYDYSQIHRIGDPGAYGGELELGVDFDDQTVDISVVDGAGYGGDGTLEDFYSSGIQVDLEFGEIDSVIGRFFGSDADGAFTTEDGGVLRVFERD